MHRFSASALLGVRLAFELQLSAILSDRALNRRIRQRQTAIRILSEGMSANGYTRRRGPASTDLISWATDQSVSQSLDGWRRVEPSLDFEDTVFDCRKTTAESTLVAFQFGNTLVVALSISVERLKKLRLTVVNSLHNVVVAGGQFRTQ